MATIESKPLPPIGKSTVAITPADRTDLINRARDVIYDYMFGNGSWWDAGPRKPWDQTVKDLQAFGEAVDASGQYIDDPDAILKSIREMIEDAIKQAQTNDATKDNIQKGLPDSNDRIEIDPPKPTRETPPHLVSISNERPQSTRTDLSGVTNDAVPETRTDTAYSSPMRYVGARVAASPGASAFDIGAPAVPFAPSSQTPLAPTPPASFNDRFGNWDVPTPGGAAPAQPRPTAMSQAPGAPPIDKDARYLARVSISPSGRSNVVVPPAGVQASAPAQQIRPPGLFGGIPWPPYLTSSQADGQSDPTSTSGLTLNDWYDRWIKQRTQQ
jgi:hypothetical protein